MEANGGYKSLLVKLLKELQIARAVVNPQQVRDFAKRLGYDAKTDPIDACVIARFGDVLDPVTLRTIVAELPELGKLNRH